MVAWLTQTLCEPHSWETQSITGLYSESWPAECLQIVWKKPCTCIRSSVFSETKIWSEPSLQGIYAQVPRRHSGHREGLPRAVISICCPTCEESPTDDTSICPLTLPPRRETGILDPRKECLVSRLEPANKEEADNSPSGPSLTYYSISLAASSALLFSSLPFLSFFISSLLYFPLLFLPLHLIDFPKHRGLWIWELSASGLWAAVRYTVEPCTSVFTVSLTQSGFLSLTIVTIVPLYVFFSLLPFLFQWNISH